MREGRVIRARVKTARAAAPVARMRRILADGVPAQSRAARGGASHRRADARARRRGQRQDARHHREDRAPRRPGRRRRRASWRSRSPTRPRARCASARSALLAAAGRKDAAAEVRISTFHALGLAIVRAEAKALGLKPRLLGDGPAGPRVDRRRARRDRRPLAHAQGAVGDQPLEERARDARRSAAQPRRTTTRRVGGEGLPALRRDARGVPGGRLRRPDPPAGRAPRARRRACARAGRRAPSTCSSTSTRTPTRRSTGCSARSSASAARFTAVGDDDQAIYGWRGATVDNLAGLERDYPGLVVVKLEQNYRSTTRILRSANALIANNAKLLDKRLWSDRGHGDAIRVVAARDEEAEAELVAAAISAHRFEHRGRWSDYAVLYRGNHQARPFEAAFRAQAIPYDVSGGQSWFERAEIKDLLRVPARDREPRRRPGVPARGLGAEARRRADDAREARRGRGDRAREPRRRRCARRRSRPSRTAARTRRCVAFVRPIDGLRRRAPREPAGRLIDELAARRSATRTTSSRRSTSARRKRKVASVREFTAWLAKKGDADRKTLVELAQTIALITMLEGRDGEGADAVRLSTLHAAKGLEFPHVFLVGLEEGILPHRESIENGAIDEERRLMYVGLTRARALAAPVVLPRAQARRRARRCGAVAVPEGAGAGRPALGGRAAAGRRGGAREGGRDRAARGARSPRSRDAAADATSPRRPSRRRRPSPGRR